MLVPVGFACKEPDEHDRYVDEVGAWCREHMPDAKAGECFDKTGY